MMEAMLNFPPVWQLLREVTEGRKSLTTDLIVNTVFPEDERERIVVQPVSRVTTDTRIFPKAIGGNAPTVEAQAVDEPRGQIRDVGCQLGDRPWQNRRKTLNPILSNPVALETQELQRNPWLRSLRTP